MRFLPNPFYIEHLKKHWGKEQKVVDYIFSFAETQDFIDKLMDMLEFLIPYYLREGKHQLIVGIGCTGGMHRSVAISEELYRELKGKGYRATVEHRDL